MWFVEFLLIWLAVTAGVIATIAALIAISLACTYLAHEYGIKWLIGFVFLATTAAIAGGIVAGG